MPKAQKTFDEVCDDIYAFVELFVFNRIRFKYKTFHAYSLRRQSKDYKHTDIPNLLHIDTDVVRSLACYADGRRYKMTDIWKSLEPKLKHHYKTYKSFKSGKCFHLPSYYELPDETLKSLFENPPTPKALKPRVKRVWSRYIFDLKKTPIPSRHSRTSQPSSFDANKTNKKTCPSTARPSDSDLDKMIDEILTETNNQAMKTRHRSPSPSRPIQPTSLIPETIVEKDLDIPPDTQKTTTTPRARLPRGTGTTFTDSNIPSPPSSIREPLRSQLTTFANKMHKAILDKKIGPATVEKLMHLLGWKNVKCSFPLVGFTEEDGMKNLGYAVKVAGVVADLIKANNIAVAKEDSRWFSTYVRVLKSHMQTLKEQKQLTK